MGCHSFSSTYQRIAIQHDSPPTPLLHSPPLSHSKKHFDYTRPLPNPRIPLPTYPIHNTLHLLAHGHMVRLLPSHASPRQRGFLRSLRIHRRFQFFESIHQRTRTRDVQGLIHGPLGAVTSIQHHQFLLTHLAHINMRRILPPLPTRPHLFLSPSLCQPIRALQNNGVTKHPIDLTNGY